MMALNGQLKVYAQYYTLACKGIADARRPAATGPCLNGSHWPCAGIVTFEFANGLGNRG
jgi:hypothetical protein